MIITKNDEAFLTMLALKTRTASLKQAANMGISARRVALLEREGLIETYTLLAAEPAPAPRPLVVWQPGDPVPDFGHLAYLLQTRWAELDVRAVRCVVTSKRFARSVGGQGGRKSRPSEGTHDLAVTGLYLGQSTERQKRWKSEDPGTNRGVKKPDAVLTGRKPVAVEQGGGSYTSSKLRGLWQWCSDQGMAVELW
jgi:hypothetical protein